MIMAFRPTFKITRFPIQVFVSARVPPMPSPDLGSTVERPYRRSHGVTRSGLPGQSLLRQFPH